MDEEKALVKAVQHSFPQSKLTVHAPFRGKLEKTP